MAKINFRQMIEGWLLHIIFSHLPTRDLISCAAVCREFYAIARADKAWERHKQRVLEYCPTLQPVFDQHSQETDGKRVLKKRQKQTPQGTWYIFARFLMRCPFQLAFERRRSNFAVVITSNVLNAAITCLYGRDPSFSISFFRKYAVDYTQKIDFIRIWIKTESQRAHFHCEWMAKTVDIYGTGWAERRIETKIVSAPFLALVHDDPFETFSKKQINFHLI
jgi:F-box-like